MLFVGVSVFSFGQKINFLDGNNDFDWIVGQSVIKIEYDYSNMSVGDYDKESDYVNKKVNEKNAQAEGSGDEWKKKWEGARTSMYQPKFEELFNKHLSKKGIACDSESKNATYTLKVITTFTEPGWKTMPSGPFGPAVPGANRNAAVSFKYVFIETSTGNEIARFSQNKVPGKDVSGTDFDVGTRLTESYAKAGKMLAEYIAKALK